MKDKVNEIRRRADSSIDLSEYWDALKCQEDRKTLLEYIDVIDAHMKIRSDASYNQDKVGDAISAWTAQAMINARATK